MTIKEAYKNTINFTGFYKKKKEKVEKLNEIVLFSNWNEEDNKNCSYVQLRSSYLKKKISENVFKKRYSKYFDKNLEINKYYKPKEPLYITSRGLITEEEYFLSKEIMKQIIPIRKNELIVGMKYKSVLEKEYLYIGDIDGRIFVKMKFGNDLKYDFTIKSILLDLKTNRLVYFSNIMLLEEVGFHNKTISYNEKEVYLKMKGEYIKNKKRYPEFSIDCSFEVSSDYDLYMKHL